MWKWRSDFVVKEIKVRSPPPAQQMGRRRKEDERKIMERKRVRWEGGWERGNVRVRVGREGGKKEWELPVSL
jgi:hypothetical protein